MARRRVTEPVTAAAWQLELRRLEVELRKLAAKQSRHGRRRTRRRVLARLSALRRSVDAFYPLLSKPAVKRDPSEYQTWYQYEYRTMRHVSRRWNRQLANEFNDFISARDRHPMKPIRFDLRPDVTRFIGRHTPDRIQLHVNLSDSQKWRTLFHEIAHYRVRGHRRAFVRELAHVYSEWKIFLRMKREIGDTVAWGGVVDRDGVKFDLGERSLETGDRL